MSDTPAQIRALADGNPDRAAYEEIADAVAKALDARDKWIRTLTDQTILLGAGLAAVHASLDEAVEYVNKRADEAHPALRGIRAGEATGVEFARAEVKRALATPTAWEDAHAENRARAARCPHTDAHHGVAGEPDLYGCDECGKEWRVGAALPRRTPRPPFDPRTAK